jgi:hypothetical protein
VSLLLAAACLGAGAPARAAETPAAPGAPTGQVTYVVGTGSLVRAAAPAPRPVRTKDSLFTGDRIDTREQSVVRLLLGGKVTVTIRELSSLTISHEPTRANVELQGGKAAIQVNPAFMRKGDAVHVYTPNAIAAVRGSLVVTEVGGAEDAQESTITALEATLPILVASRAEPERWTPLQPNQSIVIRGRGQNARLGVVRAISAEEAGRLREATALPRPDRRDLREPPGGPRAQPGPGGPQPLPGTGIRSTPPRPPASSR